MKTIVQTLAVAILFGGLSAGGSFYFQQELSKRVAAAVEVKVAAEKKKLDEKAEEDRLAFEASLAADDSRSADELFIDDTDLKIESAQSPTERESVVPPAAIRPPWDEDGDEAGELINRLRKQARATSQREQRMSEREQMLNLIFNDMRMEQAKSNKMRKRFLEEAKHSQRVVDNVKQATEAERTRLLDEKTQERRLDEEKLEEIRREKEAALKLADDAVKEVREEVAALRKQLNDLQDPPKPVDESGSPEETANIKNLVVAVDSMPPAETAKILAEFVKRGHAAGAVVVLNDMSPRNRGKVFKALTEKDAELAADLAEQLKRYKKDSNSALKPAK